MANAEEWYRALGQMVVVFGQLELAARTLVWVLVNPTDPLSAASRNTTTDMQIQQVRRELHVRESKQAPDVARAVHFVEKKLEALLQRRNGVIHSVSYGIRVEGGGFEFRGLVPARDVNRTGVVSTEDAMMTSVDEIRSLTRKAERARNNAYSLVRSLDSSSFWMN